MSNEDDDEGCMVALGRLAAMPLVLTPSALLEAWALWLCWGWFVVPLGAPPIGAAHALGLATLGTIAWVSTYLPEADIDSPFRWKYIWVRSFTHIMRTLTCVGIAWICHALM